MESYGAPAPPPRTAGWYPDPGGSGSMRYWDGTRWTDAVSSAVAPAGPYAARDDSRTWALIAHLSALISLVLGLAFIGPLVVYFVKRDDPFVHRHAAEALNFNLSILAYGTILALVPIAAGLPVPTLVGIVALLLLVWLVLVCVAATKAGQGDEYRYPLTIRVVGM